MTNHTEVDGDRPQGRREHLAWELIVEGHGREEFDLIRFMAMREEIPAVARDANNLFDALKLKFSAMPWGELYDSVHDEERLVRRAQKLMLKPTKPPTTAVGGWLRGELSEHHPQRVWGILCQLLALIQKRQSPELVKSAAALYAELREEYEPHEIIKLARIAKRKASKNDGGD